MILEVPIYVEEQRQGGWPRYSARPLLLEHGPQEAHRELERTLSRLTQRLARDLSSAGREARHDELLEAAWRPALTDEVLDLELVLRRRTLRARFLVVSFPALERRVAFTPSLPAVWFAVERGESLGARAREVFEQHYKELERKEDLFVPADGRVGIPHRAWVSTLEVEVELRQKDPRPPSLLMLLTGSKARLDGAEELRRVGRCLDWLWPDDIQRAALREPEVTELLRLLDDRTPRAVLLLGPSGAGKTAILHEAVARRIERRGGRPREKRAAWLVNGQRLISGMSHVGQWEQRLLAILGVVEKRGCPLVLDDLLGWFSAGQTTHSTLSAAQVLRPRLERGALRVVAELTPEGFARLQELDRSFADLFQVVRVDEPPREEVARVLVRTQRALEARHRCAFDLEALPAALELADAWGGARAYPGKAVTLLSQVAARSPGKPVGRAGVLDAFQATSGLELGLLDPRRPLERAKLIERLEEELVGQPEAIRALADVVLVAKARLRAPGRPMGVLLFLGPTGVGKTQAAKALSRVLFGAGDERLVRIDMNEFVSAWQVPRLVGTLAEPDGLLTGAVRRRPFSVILLDEVEKAHPDALDLLLQVLGEGRLTDGRGRTADFSGAVLVLTSNLGSREGGSALGFKDDPARARAAYLGAVERFFSPELTNRIDRIVPFARLERAEIERIARGLLAKLLERDGFHRRRSALRVDPGAMDRVVELGFDPELGARALKRSLERALVRPAAEVLAASEPGAPVVLSVFAGPPEQGLLVRVQALEPLAPATPAPSRDPEEELLRISAELRRLDGPRTGRVWSAGDLSPEERRALAATEQARAVREKLELARERILGRTEAGRSARLLRIPPRPGTMTTVLREEPRHPRWDGLFAAEDLREWMFELARTAEAGPQDAAAALAEARGELALLRAMLAGDPQARWLLQLEAASTPSLHAVHLLDRYAQVFEGLPGHAAHQLSPQSQRTAVVLEGPAAGALLAAEVGVHLILRAGSGIDPIAVRLVPLAPGEAPEGALAALEGRRRAWVDRLARGEAGLGDDPLPLGGLVRLFTSDGPGLDFRTGVLIDKALPGPETLRPLLLAGLEAGA